MRYRCSALCSLHPPVWTAPTLWAADLPSPSRCNLCWRSPGVLARLPAAPSIGYQRRAERQPRHMRDGGDHDHRRTVALGHFASGHLCRHARPCSPVACPIALGGFNDVRAPLWAFGPGAQPAMQPTAPPRLRFTCEPHDGRVAGMSATWPAPVSTLRARSCAAGAPGRTSVDAVAWRHERGGRRGSRVGAPAVEARSPVVDRTVFQNSLRFSARSFIIVRTPRQANGGPVSRPTYGLSFAANRLRQSAGPLGLSILPHHAHAYACARPCLRKVDVRLFAWRHVCLSGSLSEFNKLAI